MTNHTRQLDWANLDGRLQACDLPLNKARPAQADLTGPRCVSRDIANKCGRYTRTKPTGRGQAHRYSILVIME